MHLEIYLAQESLNAFFYIPVQSILSTTASSSSASTIVTKSCSSFLMNAYWKRWVIGVIGIFSIDLWFITMPFFKLMHEAISSFIASTQPFRFNDSSLTSFETFLFQQIKLSVFPLSAKTMLLSCVVLFFSSPGARAVSERRPWSKWSSLCW